MKPKRVALPAFMVAGHANIAPEAHEVWILGRAGWSNVRVEKDIDKARAYAAEKCRPIFRTVIVSRVTSTTTNAFEECR